MSNLSKSPITTHILNLESGTPASGVKVNLISPKGEVVSSTTTDIDGRIMIWPETFQLSTGNWQLIFFIEDWFASQNKTTFFSNISLAFKVDEKQPHYHIPLLLNAYGYSTYRGS